jgi:hypothetical protein
MLPLRSGAIITMHEQHAQTRCVWRKSARGPLKLAQEFGNTFRPPIMIFVCWCTSCEEWFGTALYHKFGTRGSDDWSLIVTKGYPGPSRLRLELERPDRVLYIDCPSSNFLSGVNTGTIGCKWM